MKSDGADRRVGDPIESPRDLIEALEPLKLYQRVVKRASDIILGSVALVILSPAWLLICVWIRLDSPGPILFRQWRRGRRGKLYVCYKFRTMYVDTPDQRSIDGSSFTEADSVWVTRAGRFLRRMTLDELPQFINVLRGEMSVVGPRPDLPDQAQYYRQDDWRRLLVRPGMSGLAWVSGRNSLPWVRRRDLDLEYVEH